MYLQAKIGLLPLDPMILKYSMPWKMCAEISLHYEFEKENFGKQFEYTHFSMDELTSTSR